MNAIRVSSRKRRRKRFNRLLALVLLVVVAATVSSWPGRRDGLPALEASYPPPSSLLPPAELTETKPKEAAPEEPDNIITYAIAPGDTLGAIFDRLDLGHTAMYKILRADEPLALETLRPGNRLTFTLDSETRSLEEMELFIHAGNRVIYRNIDGSNFDFEEIILPGEWEQEVLSGEINGSFYISAKNAGLTEGETAQVATLLGERLNFAREIRAGDRFQIVRYQQFVNGEPTGQTRIEGVRILRGNRIHSAFLADDGNYYDHNGDSLMRAFQRYPSARQFRISSAFNPARRHPITGRVSPHNGVDFAMPIGTPVLSIGDGVVTRVQNHPYAGKYIEIQHGANYVTRYLHLDRFLVKRGQTVSRGQRIALSGNTGRSTGPHLHFEFHVRGRPVNPLTANIPLASSIPKEQRKSFQQKVAEFVSLMEAPDERIAMRRSSDRDSTQPLH
jgi:murein DD-endopeptidase